MWNPQEAQYALNELIGRRRIRMADVRKVFDDRQKEIKQLREKIAELESLGGGGRLRHQTRAAARAARRPKRKLSAQARSQLRLQGAYMGYVRRLTAAQKREVRKVREAKGWREAIRMAAGLLKTVGQKR